MMIEPSHDWKLFEGKIQSKENGWEKEADWLKVKIITSL